VGRGSVGLASDDARDGTRGAVVSRVYRGSPAEAAGIAPGDIIVSANGERIASAEALHNLEGLLPVGQPVRLEVLRDGAKRTVDATLKALPKDIDGAQIDARLAGATFTDLPERYRSQGLRGVILTKVAAGSRAARNELDSGDMVLGINRRAVSDMNDFRAQMAAKPEPLVLVVQRGGARGELQMQ
jgi:serine protease DegQ